MVVSGRADKWLFSQTHSMLDPERASSLPPLRTSRWGGWSMWSEHLGQATSRGGRGRQGGSRRSPPREPRGQGDASDGQGRSRHHIYAGRWRLGCSGRQEAARKRDEREAWPRRRSGWRGGSPCGAAWCVVSASHMLIKCEAWSKAENGVDMAEEMKHQSDKKERKANHGHSSPDVPCVLRHPGVTAPSDSHPTSQIFERAPSPPGIDVLRLWQAELAPITSVKCVLTHLRPSHSLRTPSPLDHV